MEKTLIGVIVRSQGLKGEVKVEPYTSDPKRFLNLKSIYIEGGNNPMKILHCREHRGNVFLLLENTTNREAAEALRNKKIYIDKKDRVKLPDGHYFIEDIVGAEVLFPAFPDNRCKIISEAKHTSVLGTLVEVLQYGAADVFRVKTGKGMCMFPSIKAVVLDVDSENKKITVDFDELQKVIVYED